jgi:outer membrane immunogenic protein
MKKLFAVSVTLVFLESMGAALAVDIPMPAHKAPPAAAAYYWNGFYIGASGGYGWSDGRNADTSLSPVGNDASSGILFGSNFFDAALSAIPTSLNTRSKGFLGGAQVGYNSQMGLFVSGIEADFSGGSVKGSDSETGVAIATGGMGSFPFPIEATTRNDLDFFGTFRGRLGVTPLDRVLIYATGGLAYGHATSATTTSDVPTGFTATPAFGSASGMLTGWTAGGGFESGFSFAPNVSLKVEYLYYDLGQLNYSLSPSIVANNVPDFLGTITTHVSSTFKGNIVRLGLNLRLN